MHAREIVALVTGANRGIGRAIVEELIAAGARHVYAASRGPLDYEPGEQVTQVRLDVTRPVLIEEAAARCTDVNVVVNNAGVLLGQSLLGAPDHHAAEAEMRVNYFGTLQMCRAFAPVLARNGGRCRPDEHGRSGSDEGRASRHGHSDSRATGVRAPRSAQSTSPTGR